MQSVHLPFSLVGTLDPQTTLGLLQKVKAGKYSWETRFLRMPDGASPSLCIFHRRLEVHLKKWSFIALVCAKLHNFCIRTNQGEPPPRRESDIAPGIFSSYSIYYAYVYVIKCTRLSDCLHLRRHVFGHIKFRSRRLE